MIKCKIDEVEFKLKSYQDLFWLKKYGTVFSVIDETGSGCICFGVENNQKKYFFKIAGAYTVEAEVTPEESIKLLKKAVKVYEEIKFDNLIKLIQYFDYENFFVVIYEWAEGKCLFDHWNFDKYSKNSELETPANKFGKLSTYKKIKVIDVLFSFLEEVSNKNYVAVDFYDSSIIYDFENDDITLCDIDLFSKKPCINYLGENYPGTKRLKAPEEYIYNATIDEVTNVYTLGAIIFDIFGEFSKEDINIRYIKKSLFPCSRENWLLNKESYEILLKATSIERNNRFQTMSEFHYEWNKVINN